MGLLTLLLAHDRARQIEIWERQAAARLREREVAALEKIARAPPHSTPEQP